MKRYYKVEFRTKLPINMACEVFRRVVEMTCLRDTILTTEERGLKSILDKMENEYQLICYSTLLCDIVDGLFNPRSELRIYHYSDPDGAGVRFVAEDPSSYRVAICSDFSGDHKYAAEGYIWFDSESEATDAMNTIKGIENVGDVELHVYGVGR